MSEQLTRIGPHAFSDCTQLKSFTLNNQLQRIERAAFADCANLAKLDITEGVWELGGMALFDCASNLHVYLPRSLTSFGDDVLGDRFMFPDNATTHVYANRPSHQFGVKMGNTCVLR